jgi:LysR family transcriptional activator of nhaA
MTYNRIYSYDKIYMYKLNFNHLHYFLTISEEGSIVKAAKKLNMTQPSLSHQLKLLEQDLGKKLFDRVGRSLQLNSEGYLVKDYAMSIFRQTEEMLEVVKSQVSHKIKIIKIGAVSWLSKDQIYEIIKPLIFSPYVKIILKTAPLEELLRELNGNKLDLIFCDSPYSGRYRKLTGHKIYSDPIYCVSHKKSKPKGTLS